jgi:hypothetical protein
MNKSLMGMNVEAPSEEASPSAAATPCVLLNQDVAENIFTHLEREQVRRMRLVCKAWRAGVDANVKHVMCASRHDAAVLQDLILGSKAWPNAETLIIVTLPREGGGSGVAEPTGSPCDRLCWPGLKTIYIRGDYILAVLLDALQGNFPCLESLTLYSTGFCLGGPIVVARLGPEAVLPVDLLVRADFWGGLKFLSLRGNFIINEHAMHFLVPRLPPGLTKLDLSYNGFSEPPFLDGAPALGAARLLLLEELSFAVPDVSDEAVAAGMRGVWPELRHLNVNYANWGVQTVVALQEANLRKLTELDLSGKVCCLTVQEAEMLAAAEFDSLSWLLLMECRIDAEIVAKLAAAPWFLSLAGINLGRNSLRDEGAAILANTSSRGFRPTYLDIFANHITSVGLTALVRSGVLAMAERLEVKSNPLGEDGLDAIAEAVLPLKNLNCNDCNLSDATVRRLLENDLACLLSLSFISIKGNKDITDDTMELLNNIARIRQI